MNNNEVSAPELIGRIQSDSRTVSILEWARASGKECRLADLPARSEEFYRLPYSERRKWHVRPNRFAVAVARASFKEAKSVENVNTAKAISAYRKSGDAAHALRASGMELGEPWVEQKRNSEGLVEILESDLKRPDDEEFSGSLEVAEQSALESGLYDGLPLDHPEPPEVAAAAELSAEALLAVARDIVPAEHMGIFLACEVDGLSRREVARGFGVSYRQVWQTVESVKNTLLSIAREAKGGGVK